MNHRTTLTGWLILALAAFAAANGFQLLPPAEQRLDNGLTVLVTPLPASPVVAVYALVKAGSATEGEFLGAGMTHFMEHMLFKGTERRKVGEIAQAVLAVGGTINASTGYDYTIYTINVPRDGVPTAIDVLADMLQNARFDAEELDREREVVYREMNMRNDSPDSYLNDLVGQTAYTRHPYRLPIIGFEDVLEIGRAHV